MPGMSITPPRIPAPRSHLYLPDGWDTGWKEARAACATSPRWMTILGDSITGYMDSGGWANQLRARVQSVFPVYGEYWPLLDSADAYTTLSSATYGSGAPWVFNATTGRSWGSGATGQGQNMLGNRCLWASASATQPDITFTTPRSDVTRLELVNVSLVTGTFDVSIDGGAAQTTTTSVATQGYQRTSYSGLSAAQHTLRVSNQSGANVSVIDGAAAITDNTRGMGFARIALPGAKLDLLRDAAVSGSVPLDRCRQYQGAATAASASGFGFPLAPHLLIVALGINDCQAGVNPDDYQATLARLVQAVRRGVSNASVLLIGMPNPDPSSSEVTSNTFTNARQWSGYLDAMQAVARGYTCGYVGAHGLFGNQTVTAGYHTASNPHPTWPAGQTVIYGAVKSALGI